MRLSLPGMPSVAKLRKLSKLPSRSLSTRLVIVLSVVSLAVALLQSSINGLLVRHEVEGRIGHELAGLATHLGELLDRGLFDRAREIKLLANLDVLRDPREPLAVKRALLEAVQLGYPDYAWIGLADEQGRVLASTNGLLEGADVSERPWFTAALESAHVGDVHEAVLLAKLLPNPGGEPLRFVDLAVPVRNLAGERIGVLGAHLSWRWASEVERSLGARMPADRQLEVFITRSDGTVLLGPELEGQRLDLSSFAANSQNGFSVQRWPDGNTYLTGYSHSIGYRDYAGLGWTVLVRQPLSQAYGPAELTQRQIMFWTVGLALLLIVVSALVVQRLARPIATITLAAERIGAGDRSTSMPVLRRDDELGRMSLALTKLVSALSQRETEARQHAERVEALARVAKRLNTALDPATLYVAVCEETIAALGVAAVTMRRYDAKNNLLHLEYACGQPANYLSTFHSLPFGALAAELRTNEHTVIVVDPVKLDALPGVTQLRARKLRLLAVVLLRHEATLIGTLNLVASQSEPPLDAYSLGLLHGIADQAALALTNALAYEQARRRLSRLQALRRIDLAIGARYNLTTTLQIGLQQALEQLHVDVAQVWVRDPATGELRWGDGQGCQGQLTAPNHTAAPGSAQAFVCQSGQFIQLPSRAVAEHPLPYLLPPPLASEVEAYYAAPLLIEGEVVGVLELQHTQPLQPDVEWLAFFETLSGQIAIAADSMALLERLRQANADLRAAYDTTLEGWSRALDLRDKETVGHTQRVTNLTMRLAQAMGIGGDELVHARRGALLHDIGKMGVPDAVLLKPGKLNDEEWVLMKRHPVLARDLLEPIAFLEAALDIPTYHHERWDGTGYPDGLAGEEIPLVARIFAVIDVWDALRNERPYKPAWPYEQARAYIASVSGTHFDPQVVEAFLKLIDEDEQDGRGG